MNPFTGLFQSFYLECEWLLSSFGIQWAPLTDTSSSEVSDKLLKFSVSELFKFRHISKSKWPMLCFACGNYNIVLTCHI